MITCTCLKNIEILRREMTLTYDKVGSFIATALDDALVEYRKCPVYEVCNKEKWKQESHVYDTICSFRSIPCSNPFSFVADHFVE